MQDLKILIVDDHQLMIDGYLSILQKLNYKLEVMTAHTFEEAKKRLDANIRFDLILLDRSLPSAKNRSNGDDLALLARQVLPDAKILMLTSHSEAFILYNIVHKVKPDALLVKCDFDGSELLDAVEKVLGGGIYKSWTVQKVLKNITSRNGYLDNYNRQIIMLLAQGIKTKNLSEHLPLSSSAIDKRKVLIKHYLEIEKGNDEDIIRVARNLGLV